MSRDRAVAGACCRLVAPLAVAFETRSETGRVLLVSLLYAALTALMAFPFSVHPGSLVLADAPDTHLYLWTLAWDVHALTTNPLHIFDANIYHPYSNTLAYSENLIGSAFFAAPIIWMTGDLVLAMNLVALLSCVLCGVGAYVLARQLGFRPVSAFLSGIVFAFAPPRFFRMGQLHMTAVQWVPFALAYLHAYFDRGRPRDLRLFTLFFSLQALTSGHGAVFLGFSALLLTAYRLAFGEPLAIVRRIRDFGVSGAYLLAPAIWVVLPYQMAQRDAGLKRSLTDEWVPAIQSFVASPSRVHVYLQSFVSSESINAAADAFLFPGFVPVLLALTLCLPQRRPDQRPLRVRLRHSAVVFYTLLALASAWIFLRPPWGLWPLIYWLPGFNFIREPSRFMIVVMLALSVLAAAGFERLSSGLTARRQLASAVLVAALLLGEYASLPFAGLPYTLNIPAVDRWLDTLPRPFVVAELPVPGSGNLGALERQQTRSMLHSTAHWQKTIHGYSGLRRPLHDELYRDLASFPDEQSLLDLRRVGVTHVVIHGADYTPDQWRDVEPRLSGSSELRLEHSEGMDRVYSLTPSR
jgi:hypothetical protein